MKTKSPQSIQPKPEKKFAKAEKKDFNLKHPPALRPKGKRAK